MLALSLAPFGAHLPREEAQASLLKVFGPADSQDHVSEAISDPAVTEYWSQMTLAIQVIVTNLLTHRIMSF